MLDRFFANHIPQSSLPTFTIAGHCALKTSPTTLIWRGCFETYLFVKVNESLSLQVFKLKVHMFSYRHLTFGIITAGYQFDYVFDWTILKYPQIGASSRGRVSACEKTLLFEFLSSVSECYWLIILVLFTESHWKCRFKCRTVCRKARKELRYFLRTKSGLEIRCYSWIWILSTVWSEVPCGCLRVCLIAIFPHGKCHDSIYIFHFYGVWLH